MIDYLQSSTVEVQRVVREYATKDELLFLDMPGICTAEFNVLATAATVECSSI